MPLWPLLPLGSQPRSLHSSFSFSFNVINAVMTVITTWVATQVSTFFIFLLLQCNQCRYDRYYHLGRNPGLYFLVQCHHYNRYKIFIFRSKCHMAGLVTNWHVDSCKFCVTVPMHFGQKCWRARFKPTCHSFHLSQPKTVVKKINM